MAWLGSYGGWQFSGLPTLDGLLKQGSRLVSNDPPMLQDVHRRDIGGFSQGMKPAGPTLPDLMPKRPVTNDRSDSPVRQLNERFRSTPHPNDNDPSPCDEGPLGGCYLGWLMGYKTAT